MNLTYRQLQEAIAQMTDEQKDCNVTYYDVNVREYFALEELEYSMEEDNDVLDDGHPYLVTYKT